MTLTSRCFYTLQFCDSLSTAWENRPEVLKPTQPRTDLLSNLFDTSTFRKLVEKLEKQGCLRCTHLAMHEMVLRRECLLSVVSWYTLHSSLFYAEPLEFGRDLNAARYRDGKRETPNAQVQLTLHLPTPERLVAGSS